MATTSIALKIIAGHAVRSGEPYTALIDADGFIHAIDWGKAEPGHTHMTDHWLEQAMDADLVLGQGWDRQSVQFRNASL